MSESKSYLGDGVYADIEGPSLVLTTENGFEATNQIFLEPEVLDALIKYCKREHMIAEGAA